METSQTTIAMSSISADAENVATWVCEALDRMIQDDEDEYVFACYEMDETEVIIRDFSTILSSKFTNTDKIVSSVNNKRLIKYHECYFTINLVVSYGYYGDCAVDFQIKRFDVKINDANHYFHQLDA